MADTLESLEIEVKHSASGAAAEIESVANALQNLGTQLGKVLPGLKDLAGGLKNVKGLGAASNAGSAVAQSLTNTIESPDPGAVESIKSALDVGEIEHIQETVEEVVEAVKGAVSSAVDSINRGVDSVAPKLEEVSQKIKDSASDDGGDKAAGLRSKLLANADALKKVSETAKSASIEVKRFGRAAEDAGKGTKKANGPLQTFLASLKRIAFYRFIRAIIKNIVQGFQEGLQNAYAFSQGITTEGHRFSAALDSMSTAGLKMKNQIGSAFIALLAAIAPIVNTIISIITRLADAMAQLFAVFTGGTYLKAVDMPKKWGDAAAAAGKAAKEWKNQLLGFDEINRLNEPSRGRGSGGAAELDPMLMFEDTPIDGIFAKIKAKLDELRESLDFEPLRASWERLRESVQALGDTIVSALGWAWDNILLPLAHWTIEEAIPVAITLLANAFDFLRQVLEVLQPVFQWAWDNIFAPLAEWTGEIIIGALQGISDLLHDITNLLKGNTTFKQFIDDLTPLEEVLLAVATAVAVVYTALGIYNTIVGIAALVTGGLSAALAFLAANPIVLIIAAVALLVIGIIELIKHWDEVSAAVVNFQQKLHDALGDGKLDWMDFAAVAARVIMAPIDAVITLIGWIERLVGWIKTALEGLSFLPGRGAGGGGGGGNIPAFASGGFPEDGLFMANHGELVGQFSNGRTAVANNDQIVDGIRQGVFEAVSAAMNGSSQDPTPIKVYLDGWEIKTSLDRRAKAMG